MPVSGSADPGGVEVVAPPPGAQPIPGEQPLIPETPPPPDMGEEPILVDADPVDALFGGHVEPGAPGDPGAGEPTRVSFQPTDANGKEPEGPKTPSGPGPGHPAGSGAGQATSASAPAGVTVTTRVERTATGFAVTVTTVIVNK